MIKMAEGVTDKRKKSITTLEGVTGAVASPSRSGSQAWGQADGLDEPYDATRSERAMWRAVIVQALMDASCGSRKKENIQAREEALVWLRGNSHDFVTVCHHAGFEPEYVKRMIRSCLERNCTWRAAPGTGAPRKRRPHNGSSQRRATQRR